jgi:hypothetical protein
LGDPGTRCPRVASDFSGPLARDDAPHLVSAKAGGEVGDLPLGGEGPDSGGLAGEHVDAVQLAGAVDLERGEPVALRARALGGLADVEAGIAVRLHSQEPGRGEDPALAGDWIATWLRLVSSTKSVVAVTGSSSLLV